MIIDVNSNEFDWLHKVHYILARNEERKIQNTRIILVEEGNFQSGLLGFINCLQKEPGGDIFRAVLIQDLNAPKFSLNLPLYSKQLEMDLVTNVLRPGNVWGSYRHQLLPSRQPKLSYHAIIKQLVRGDLSTIRWVEGPITKDYQDEGLISIHYASLNFKDVMLPTGKIEPEGCSRKDRDCVIGFEYSGKSITGRRIMGLNRNRCLSNFCYLDKTFSWTVPESWTLEDAATVPCVYCTCISALYINGEMHKGDRILIHAGPGGIGQAAINLALREGCEVFTTVGTPEKREFIKKTFPSIDDNHIGNSRDTSFEKMIMQGTNGAGVDIVLNSLADDKFQTSLRCLTNKGRFLEIGKFDLAANNHLNSKLFMKGISFHGVMLDQIMNTNDEVKYEISSIFNKLMKENAIKPIIRTVFDQDQVETALRFMAAGEHMGKVLIKISEENEPLNTPILAQPVYICIPNKSYIVLGGLGGFGLELIDWLILRNAQNIVITSRNGIKYGYQHMRINLWKSYGVNIKILVGLDAADRDASEVIVKTAIDQSPVDGIFNLAVSLKDKLNGFLVQDKAVVASMIVAEQQNKNVVNNVVDAVINILGIKDLNSINPRTPLPELGMDSMSALEIKQILEREYEIYFTASDIRNLNLDTLMEMNNNLMENNYSHKNDTYQMLSIINILKQFYDEIHSNELVIPLNTNPVEGQDEIFFLPGIEGYADAFKILESKIKSPATCFQFQTNYELKTIEAMANFVLSHILERLKDRRKFMLIGHSFGSLVAIELARMLEAKGFIGRLILIDGAPQYLKKFIQENLRSSSQEELENNILLSVMNAYVAVNCSELELELKKCNSWDEKINTSLNVLSSEHKELFLKADRKNALLSLYMRMRAITTYNPEPMPYLRSPITLFKPQFPSILNVTYDYGLQNITEGKVDVHVVEGNHTTMLGATEISMAINGELFECAAIFKENWFYSTILPNSVFQPVLARILFYQLTFIDKIVVDTYSGQMIWTMP
ncbi:hypothetical protein HZH68_004060 [Vespula germanica]|uniref:oleoyl-[acyl-carrier-protein] hydrolase n=1 Tax=Vespula germanica TaxID=30212 RepID=A0A836XMB6_VESGE|nr:hypothetical protein HZH68_004060 [Vespula germanica]